MPKNTTLKATVAGLALLVSSGATAQTLLPEPQAVPVDFLAWLDKDTRWLQSQLSSMGVMAPPDIQGGVLETDSLATLKAANRIRAFAFLAAKGLRPPLYDLTLTAEGGDIRCLTQFPYSVVPDLGPMDFARPSFPAAGADPAILQACTVTEDRAAAYASLDRDSFRAQYFDAYGVLKPEFEALSADPAFMARAVDLGFFLGTEDYSGLLRVDLS